VHHANRRLSKPGSEYAGARWRARRVSGRRRDRGAP